MNSIEQLREQQKALQAQIEAAEQVAREERERQAEVARKAAEQEKARREEYAKTGITNSIVVAIKTMRSGINVTATDGMYPRIEIEGMRDWSIRVEQKYERIQYSSRKEKSTGLYQVIIETSMFDSYDSHRRKFQRSRERTKRFPPRKDGTHAYASIADWLLYLYDAIKARAVKEHAVKVNTSKSVPLVNQLTEKYGNKKGISIQNCSTDGTKVNFMFNGLLTFDEADAAIIALTKLGFIT